MSFNILVVIVMLNVVATITLWRTAVRRPEKLKKKFLAALMDNKPILPKHQPPKSIVEGWGVHDQDRTDGRAGQRDTKKARSQHAPRLVKRHGIVVWDRQRVCGREQRVRFLIERLNCRDIIAIAHQLSPESLEPPNKFLEDFAQALASILECRRRIDKNGVLVKNAET